VPRNPRGPRHVRFRTLAYASCEQLEGRRADPRDDLYALACISYELLRGFILRITAATVARNYRVSVVRPAASPVDDGERCRRVCPGIARGVRSVWQRGYVGC